MAEINHETQSKITNMTVGDVKHQDVQQDPDLDINEIFARCRKHWWWFIISLVICVGAAWIYGKRQQPVYERESLVLIIRNDGSQGDDISQTFQSLGFFHSNPEKRTDLVAITAPSVMMEVVRRLALNVHYSTDGRWYDPTLYGANQPILVTFPGWTDESTATIDMEIQPGGIAVIKSISRTYNGGVEKYEDLDIKAKYISGETVKTPVGPISIALNPVYSGGDIKEPMPVKVNRASIYNTTMSLSAKLEGSTIDDWADVISMKITDVSTQRAEDILNTIVSVYNEDWVRERSRIAEATSRFINDRLNIIEHELGNVDTDIAGYKSANLVPDVQATASMYVDKANRASEALVEMSNRLAMTRYVREFMTSSSNSNAVLPANTGVADINIESQIAEYNKTLMERNSLASNSSASNPL
ncbi:MAG: Wzz/FepE/Etk N-terminal domain-containing protein, partial [Bacteroides sp.]|nr:Wzz/FepE/Etk N-terminal domain-containing protein [Bacteroides sp.]